MRRIYQGASHAYSSEKYQAAVSDRYSGPTIDRSISISAICPEKLAYFRAPGFCVQTEFETACHPAVPKQGSMPCLPKTAANLTGMPKKT
jgi:hypothetical protein